MALTKQVPLNEFTVAVRKYLRMAAMETLGISPNRVSVPVLSIDDEIGGDGRGKTYVIRGTLTVNLDGVDAVESV